MHRLTPVLFILVAACTPAAPDHVFTTPQPLERSGCANRVLFKADDVGDAYDMDGRSSDPWRYRGRLSERWVKFFEIILSSPDLTANAGVIGRSLDIAPEEYGAQLAELSAFPERITFWNHGYTHEIFDDGRCEYWYLDAEEAESHLLRTQEAAAGVGVGLIAFGAPCNHWTSSTAEAMDAVDIPYWFFGDEEHPGNLTRTVEIESRPGHPSLVTLEATWKTGTQPVVLQIHPNGWDDEEFAEFEAAVDWMRDEGACFITLDEL